MSVQPLSEAEKCQRLSETQLCLGLTSDDLVTLASRLREVTIPAGKNFIEHDSCTNQVFVILEGQVEVAIPLVGNRGQTVLAKLGRGETVGEFALIREARRAASSRALTELKVLVTESDDLMKLFEVHPRIGYLVFRNLSRIIVDRLVDTNMAVRNVMSQMSL